MEGESNRVRSGWGVGEIVTVMVDIQIDMMLSLTLSGSWLSNHHKVTFMVSYTWVRTMMCTIPCI
jgi:hypothetical protein